QYNDATLDVINDLSQKVSILKEKGVKDIIIDPGFGFSKTLEQNYTLLNNLEKFQSLNAPLLVGVSRKSMIYNTLGGSPDTALNGTTVINTLALTKGAHILRVHDVKEAVEAVKLTTKTLNS
ncbi:MAG: dihydropteroate synthase, partial [Muribaculaceae bacterium]|nr:dihydropteroate synthase [Muribaculaceae bacterium]